MNERTASALTELFISINVHCSALLARHYSPTYGNKAMKRARLMASVTACWLAAVQPLLRRLTILPWRLVSLLRSSKSL